MTLATEMTTGTTSLTTSRHGDNTVTDTNRASEEAPTPMRTTVTLAVTVLLAGFFACFVVVAEWPLALSYSSAGSAAISDTDLGGYLVQTVLFALLPAVAFVTPWRAKFGVASPRGPVLPRFLQATALVVLVQTTVGVAASHVAAAVSPDTAPSLSAVLSHSFEERVVIAAHAAVQEEVLNIVTPTVLVITALAGMRLLVATKPTSVLAAMDSVAPWPTSWRLWVAVACSAGVVTRVLDHLYQGPIHAAAGAVWGGLLVAIYTRYRSVLPLILGHFLFDALIALSPWALDWWWSLAIIGPTFLGAVAWERVWSRARPSP